MYTLFFDLPSTIKGFANAKVFKSIDELKAYLNDSVGNVDIAGIGYCNKSICKEEFREVWTTGTEPKMVGKIIQVEDVTKFKKSIHKWVKTFEDANPEDAVKIKDIVDSLQ